MRPKSKRQIRSQAAQLRVLIEELRVEVARRQRKAWKKREYHLKQRIQTLEEAEKQRIEQQPTPWPSVWTPTRKRWPRWSIISTWNRRGRRPPSPAPGDAAVTEPVAVSDAELYAMAKKAFDNKGFETSLKGFQKLIQAYPKSEHADNAQFWIGEIYYREKWYEKAILEYQKVIENYPKGNKVRAALLKQGFAFSNLGDKANARLILKELVKKYPDANEAVIAKKKLLEVK